MIICLIRHGQTDWNKAGIVQGHSDQELNETGKSEAKMVSEYLKVNDPYWDLIIASPLKRAHETANIIKKELNHPKDILLNNKVIERFFGEYEGHIINKTTFEMVENELVKDMELHKDLFNRSLNALLEIERTFKHEKVMVITHSHFIKSVIVQLDPTFSFRSYLKNTSLNYIEIKDQKIKLLDYNINP